jgi:hypothetical protein
VIEYLTLDDVLALIDDLGVGPIRDIGLLDSAVHRPQVTVYGDDAYPDLDQKAAVLLESLVRNSLKVSAAEICRLAAGGGRARSIHLGGGVCVLRSVEVVKGVADAGQVLARHVVEEVRSHGRHVHRTHSIAQSLARLGDDSMDEATVVVPASTHHYCLLLQALNSVGNHAGLGAELPGQVPHGQAVRAVAEHEQDAVVQQRYVERFAQVTIQRREEVHPRHHERMPCGHLGLVEPTRFRCHDWTLPDPCHLKEHLV